MRRGGGDQQRNTKNKSKSKRREIREWMEEGNLELKTWLEQCTNHPNLFESGEMPVTGWVQLLQTIQEPGDSQALKEELEQTESEISQLEDQLQTLHKKKENLGIEKKRRENVAALQSGSANQLILKFAAKEQKQVTQLHEKLDSYLDLDAQDVSTIFSLYEMDHLFHQYKKKESEITPGEILNSTAEDLKDNLKLELKEAAEMHFKFQLLQNGEFSVDHHLSKCSICSRTNLLTILAEYGVKFDDNERSHFLEKSKEWKGYFLICFSAVNAV